MSDYTRLEDQEFEKNWWGNCCWTFGEENKQITYAHRMGLEIHPNEHEKWPIYDLEGKSVLDIGGGPVSMLLKTFNGANLTVIDPCDYPDWTIARYRENNIDYIKKDAEDFYTDTIYNECWIYNVLQHVIDPVDVLQAAQESAETIRIFEWIDTPPSLGHPHTLTAEFLDSKLDGKGTVEHINENNMYGKAYYGVFGS